LSHPPLIAVIDDDHAMREALVDLLEVYDFRCTSFDSARSFMGAHAITRFDAVITDLNLQGESGLDLQQRIRSIDPDLPVILISAQSDPCIRSEALRSGVLAFLLKPVDDQVLHRHLISALTRARRERTPP
jgi:two-component system, LuxR family, response regulator FixJ